MARIIFRYPDNTIREIEFDQPRYRIGSAKDNDLVLENEGVSLYQAEIETSHGIYSIVEVSENKTTTINGKKFDRSNLNYGDRVSFGPVIGLFYPAQRKKLGERTKLYLYLGAGGFVILFSIALIFFLISRQISRVVSEQIGVEVPSGEVTQAAPSVPLKKERGIEKEAEIKKVVPEGPGLRPGIKALIKKEKLELPEPGHDSLAMRDAIAIPRGLNRLFFRKMPILVEREVPEPLVSEVTPAITEKPEGEAEVIIPEEPISEEVQGEKEKAEGLFSRIFSPLRRLFGGKGKLEIAQEEIVSEGVTEEAEKPVETPRVEVAEKPPEELVDRLLDPLSALSRRETLSIGESSFVEEPVYSEEEIVQIKQKSLTEGVKLSKAENVNIETLWRYPVGLEKGQRIERTGVLGKMDDNRSMDYVLGSMDGRIIVLNGDTGEEIINQELGKPFFEPMVEDVDGDKQDDIIVAFMDGDIRAFTRDIETIWYYQGKDSIITLPLMVDLNDDGVSDIVFTELGMDIVAIDGRMGLEIWRFFDAESETILSPLAMELNEDTVKDVLFLTRNGFLYALDGKTGWGLWRRGIFGKPVGSVIGDINGDSLWEIVSLTEKGILSCYNRDGKLLFTMELMEKYITPPSLGDVDGDGTNEVVLIDAGGLIRAVEGKTRREKWNFETGEGPSLGRVSLVDINVDGGLDILFATYSGVLFILDGKTGSQLGLFNFGSYATTTPIVYDINRDRLPEILMGTYGGDVFALRSTESRKRFLQLKKSFWMTKNHDKNNTGYSSTFFMNNPWD